ncbi:MAG: RNA polymerase factor sigma-54 [Pseudomonadota bacterium]
MQGLRLELRQTQSLVMTPQLQQAIRLLQMSNLELEAHVLETVESNPLLALEDGMGEAPSEGEAANRDKAPGEDPGASLDPFDTGLATENLTDAPAPRDPSAERPMAAAGTGIGAPEPLERQDWPAEATSLRAHLSEQICQCRLAPEVRAAALLIIEALEDDGYLREPLSALGERLGLTADAATTGLAAVQACDPTGVGARDLAECLALQLAERNRLDPMMRILIDNLALLARGDARRLAAVTGAEPDDIADMLADLRRLDPRPGARFGGEIAQPRVPDVLLTKGRSGGWDIALNPETMPRVHMDETFLLRLDARGQECDRWIAERRSEAQWLVRSMAKRAETILNVTREIVRAQEGFFEIGAAGLRPLTLRKVAEETGLHESTVSRVAANKLVATPRGVFELKFFFTNAVGEDDMAAETVRQRLKALVATEPADAVLSDDELVRLLRAEGIEIARRTVAKYRKVLKIPSSIDRRRRKAFA